MIDPMLKYLDNSSTESDIIFKVNVGLRESNPDVYTPKMVSIGPYHRENRRLGPMKKHKLLYLRRFLRWKEGLDLNNCIRELHKLKEEALKCYEDIKEHGNYDDFLTMLLLDGCFVVEFIREHCELCPEGEARIIIDNRASYIFRDLLLLENQLPFFVINKLHSMTKHFDESSLVGLVNDVCNYFMPLVRRTECYNVGNIKHLLQLFHIFYCRQINPRKKSNTFTSSNKVMPTATELSEAGVSFAKVSDNMTSLLDIKFESTTGLMTIPCLLTDLHTEIILRNLIAYEQQSSDVERTYFSDYAVFMDNLIDSEKDVNLLRQKGIIVNFMGDDKNVASLFNTIRNGVMPYPDFYYNEEFKQATEYSEKPWNRMKANLKHNYFSSPWVGASTVAAIILLLLTLIQTILAITSSFKSNK
ncbi:hypothetical protein H5410_019937 [Solanum commersonii]|uniref:Uncharacterized protein n=1 Tax=Solanum commersonii TaxID=4109 RepID=A0A9J5Z9R3_SOLCO|nr:hypothetical protein H5410_019937 [Solanum commersonii]